MTNLLANASPDYGYERGQYIHTEGYERKEI
jgi:hypothetical protein